MFTMFRAPLRSVAVNLTKYSSVKNYSSDQCSSPQIAVVLSGCGVYDGTEIHEAAAVLSHITRNNATPHIFAPKLPQMHVVNHKTGQPDTKSTRCVFAESARIARGNVKPLKELAENLKHFKAVVFPGGFGVAKNLSDFAEKGVDCTVISDVRQIIEKSHKDKIQLGFACIAPILAARVLCNVTITLGQMTPAELWPHNSAIEAAKAMGATLELKGVDDVSYDRVNQIYSTPAYMYEGKYHEIDDGIGKMIKYMILNMKN